MVSYLTSVVSNILSLSVFDIFDAKNRGFRAQRFYLNLLPVLGFLHHSTDLDEPDKPVASVFF